MPPIVSIVGKSGSGKTFILERLIKELKGRAYRIACIKHEAHGFDIDHPGKDSWRLTEAGSDLVILGSPQKVASIRVADHDLTLGEFSPLIGEGIDLVLTEGYKTGKAPKIEVHRQGFGELLCSPQELSAAVTDEPLDIPAPQYSPDDIAGLADFVEKNFIPSRREEVVLWINGAPTPLNPFVQNIMSKVLLAMVSTLKGTEETKNLQLWLKKG